MFLLSSTTLSVNAADIANGKKIVDVNCVACHQDGVMGAPKIGVKADWEKRAKQGVKGLIKNAVNGLGSMPAKGGNHQLSESDIADSVAYFLDSAKVKASASPKAKVDPKKANGVTRERLRLSLDADNIESRPLWKPLHLQPVCKDSEYYGGKVAEELFQKGLCLPSGSNLSQEDLNRIVKIINQVFATEGSKGKEAGNMKIA